MSGLHPQYMLSKRFPVHAAIELQDLKSIATLLCNAKEARYHFDRKLTNNEVSILHQACCARTTARQHWLDIIKVCINLGADVNDVDCIGQTPLFYAVSHCQAKDIVPLLIEAGAVINQARWSDNSTALHIAAMMGQETIVELLLKAGANPSMQTSDGQTASQVAINFHYKRIADKINRSSTKLVKMEKQIEKKANIMENVSIFKPNNIIVPQNNTHTTPSYNYNAPISDGDDEVSWALKMKKELEETKKKEELDKKRKNEEQEHDNKSAKTTNTPRRKTQEEKMRELKAKREEELNNKDKPSQSEQMVNILEVMEKKRQRRMAAKSKMSEKERLEKEQASVKEAMYEEMIWALKLQKEIAEECGNTADVEKYEKMIILEQEKKDGTYERRIKQKQKEEEEKIKKEILAKEHAEQEAKRKEEEIKRKKEQAAKWAEEQKKIEEEMRKRKEQEAYEKLPQWKKDKLKRESRCLESDQNDEIRNKKETKLSPERDPLESLPKWKRDKILKERQIEEEKLRQEEEKKRELELIRDSIRKKMKKEKDEEEMKDISKEEKTEDEEEMMNFSKDNTLNEEEKIDDMKVDKLEDEEKSVFEEGSICQPTCQLSQETEDYMDLSENDDDISDNENFEENEMKVTETSEEEFSEQNAEEEEEQEERLLDEQQNRKEQEHFLREQKMIEERLHEKELKRIEQEKQVTEEKERLLLEKQRREEERAIAKEREREEERIKREKEEMERKNNQIQLELEERQRIEKMEVLKKEENQRIESYLQKVEERIKKREEEQRKIKEENRISLKEVSKHEIETTKIDDNDAVTKTLAEPSKMILETSLIENHIESVQERDSNAYDSPEKINIEIFETEKLRLEKKKKEEEEEMRLYLLKVEERMRKRSEEANRKMEEERQRFLELERKRIEEAKIKAENTRKIAEDKARKEAEEEARLAEEKAKRIAEEEARRVAEEEARKIAAEKARQLAEKQARQAAEEEARRAAKVEARRAAEVEARRAAEEEARKAAEEEARRGAEEEARQAAEEETRKAAEEEAKRAAEEENEKREGEVLSRKADEEDSSIAKKQKEKAEVENELENKSMEEGEIYADDEWEWEEDDEEEELPENIGAEKQDVCSTEHVAGTDVVQEDILDIFEETSNSTKAPEIEIICEDGKPTAKTDIIEELDIVPNKVEESQKINDDIRNDLGHNDSEEKESSDIFPIPPKRTRKAEKKTDEVDIFDKPKHTFNVSKEIEKESLKFNDENSLEFVDHVEDNRNAKLPFEANSELCDTNENGSSMEELIKAAKGGVVSFKLEDKQTYEENEGGNIKSDNQLDDFISLIQARLQEVKLLKEKRKLEQEKRETLTTSDLQHKIPDLNYDGQDQDKEETSNTNESEETEISIVDRSIQEDTCNVEGNNIVEQIIKQEEPTDTLETNIGNENEILQTCIEEDQNITLPDTDETECFNRDMNEDIHTKSDEGSVALNPDDKESLQDAQPDNNILQNGHHDDFSNIEQAHLEEETNGSPLITKVCFDHQVEEEVEDTNCHENEDLQDKNTNSLELSREDQLKDTMHLEKDNNDEVNDLNNNADENGNNPIPATEETLDLKEKAVEEKQMLDRLISMVQAKINLVKRNKEEETK